MCSDKRVLRADEISSSRTSTQHAASQGPNLTCSCSALPPPSRIAPKPTIVNLTLSVGIFKSPCSVQSHTSGAPCVGLFIQQDTTTCSKGQSCACITLRQRHVFLCTKKGIWPKPKWSLGHLITNLIPLRCFYCWHSRSSFKHRGLFGWLVITCNHLHGQYVHGFIQDAQR